MRGAACTLPLLPLREGILLPGAEGRFYVGRVQSLKALKRAQEGDRRIFCLAQKDAKQESPGDEEDFVAYGTIARIESIRSSSKGARLVTLQGLVGAELMGVDMEQGEADIRPIAENDDLGGASINAFLKRLRDFGRIPPNIIEGVVRTKLLEGETGPALQRLVEATGIAPQIASALIGEPQKSAQLAALLDILNNCTETEGLREQLNTRVRQRIRETQREYVLREILRDVKGELGMDDARLDDAGGNDELAAQLKKTALSPEARKRAEREMGRLEIIPPMSPEYGLIRTYLEWLRDLPWGQYGKEEESIARVRRKLEKSHYGLDDVKRGILEFVASRRLAGDKGRGSILCLVGPPGTGKTSLASAIADALGRKFVRMSLGGMRDEAEIRGHRRTYVGALPGRILQHLRKAGSVNPVFLLDEIDKLGNDYRGDPSSALLEVLDPEINASFQDHYLEVEFDLSQVFFVTTANSVYGIPHALSDRMEVIQIPGYTALEKRFIAERYLVPRQLERCGIPAAFLEICEDALQQMIHEYTREAGVRSLEREIQKICRKHALLLLEKKAPEHTRVRAADLADIIGKPRFTGQETLASDRAGLVHGLAWTESGGQVLDIEARLVPGKGNLVLTGKLGSVMQESAQAACTLARCLAARWVEQDLTELDIHIHAPEASIPKDGPSAGITIASAVISAITGEKAVSEMALTGEVTLLGRVLAIGGLKEKVLAAKRLGIKTILLPEGNAPDIEELDAKIKRGVYFRTVRDMDEVLDHVIPGLRRIAKARTDDHIKTTIKTGMDTRKTSDTEGAVLT
jgi:ATP-dependent Lon protease